MHTVFDSGVVVFCDVDAIEVISVLDKDILDSCVGFVVTNI